MADKKAKSINSLMKYLREQKVIDIWGAQKKSFRNIGYYHGYKGYRFFSNPNNKLNYTNYTELKAVYDFDMQIKTLFYPPIMFIETAMKNYTLESILSENKSGYFEEIYMSVLNDYKSYPIESGDYKDALKKRLSLRNKIYGVLSRDYPDKLIVRHFYETSRAVPIWAIFELLSFGEFGEFYSCLKQDIRVKVSKALGINTAFDVDGKLPKIIIFALKDLRNAIAHNDTVFDNRFKTGKISLRLPQYLCNETGITNIDFSTISDYVVLISYMLKQFGCTKKENKKFVRDFISACEALRNKVFTSISSKIIHTSTRSKMNALLKYL